MLSNTPNGRVNQLLPPLGFWADLAALATGFRQSLGHSA
jgi:hypothetical protein